MLTLKQELISLGEAALGTEVDMTHRSPSLSDSYIRQIAKQLGLKLSTRVVDGRMMVRIKPKGTTMALNFEPRVDLPGGTPMILSLTPEGVRYFLETVLGKRLPVDLEITVSISEYGEHHKGDVVKVTDSNPPNIRWRRE